MCLSRQTTGTFQRKSFLLKLLISEIFRAVEELNVRPLNITHVYSPDSERSDKWMVECATADEANRLAHNPPFLFGRQSQSDMLDAEAAQDIYTNGYQGRWQKSVPDKRTRTHQNLHFPKRTSIFLLIR
jgi:hypothetical protein